MVMTVGRPSPPSGPETRVAAGPLREHLAVTRDSAKLPWKLTSRTGHGLESANALTVLRRVVWAGGDEEAAKALAASLRWAAAGNGQPRALVEAAAGRRQAAMDALAAQGFSISRLVVRPSWRLVVGLGASSDAHETSLALHGTYGVPVLPGTALKGVASRAEPDPARRREAFGGPRPGERGGAARGPVAFLDALPAGPVPLVHDVMTPHAGPYYAKGEPPAEYWEPVPVDFLAVAGGSFTVDLVARDPGAATHASRLLAGALQDQGLGAKTAAGYGYFEVGPAAGGVGSG
jgi:CRISPR-associated protein Cmr6